MKALIDGAASRSFLGRKGRELIEELNLEVRTNSGIVQVANGQVELVTDEVLVPMELKLRARQLQVRVLPSLPVPLVLGLDFLQIFGLQVDYAKRRWRFEDDHSGAYDFEVEDWTAEDCCGIRELSLDQSSRLNVG